MGHRFIFCLLRILPLIGFCAISYTASAQRYGKSNDIQDVRSLFSLYTDALFQEKVYVHTDKDSYLAGETMWFLAYRMDGMNHSPHYYSGLVYVELRDPENHLVKRMMFRRTDKGFEGSYTLPTGMASGYYNLVAYTNWMQNFDSDFYFKKRVYVYNASDSKVDAAIQYTHIPEDNVIAVEFTATNEIGTPYSDIYLNVQTHSAGEKMDVISRITDKQGRIKFNLRQDANLTGVEIWFRGALPVDYKHYFKIPLFDYDIDVQFMPEGGHLLDGVEQKVAFKAIGVDGLGVTIEGDVYDEDDNLVASIASTHLGMGIFTMKPVAGRKYHAKVTTKYGRRILVDLPEVAAEGISVTTQSWAGTLTFRAVATEGYKTDGLNMVFHSRGKLISWTPLAQSDVIQIPVANIPEGVSHCFIVSDNGEVYSERLVFINRDDPAHDIALLGLKSRYGRREKVEVEVDLSSRGIAPLSGDLSVSVVDAVNTTHDGSENIVSDLLLSSDIKGRVEDASYYFDRSVSASVRARNADLVMMTQGWKRFDVGAAFRKELPKLDFAVELGQSISGKITRRAGKDAKGGELALLGTKDSKLLFAEDIKADTAGYFSFNVSFPNTSILLVQGTHKEGKGRNVDVRIDTMRFKAYPYDTQGNIVQPGELPAPGTLSGIPAEYLTPEAFYARQAPKYFYDDKGEKVYALEEVEIIARRETPDWKRLQRNASLQHSATPEEMMEQGYYTVHDWLVANIPGISFEYNWEEYIREDDVCPSCGPPPGLYCYENVSIVLNNRRAHISFTSDGDLLADSRWPDGHLNPISGHGDLLEMPLSAFKQIKTSATANYEDIRLADVPDITKSDRLHIHLRPLHTTGYVRRNKMWIYEFARMGYTQPDKFYSPKYEGIDSDNGEDERVTVFWQPNVKVDKDGKARISFYTTDVDTKYRMTVQGLAMYDRISGVPIFREIEFSNGNYNK